MQSSKLRGLDEPAPQPAAKEEIKATWENIPRLLIVLVMEMRSLRADLQASRNGRPK